MAYKAALRLAEIAKQGSLLGDPLIRSIIRGIAVDDDPELEEEAEAYIGIRALESKMSEYRRNRRQG